MMVVAGIKLFNLLLSLCRVALISQLVAKLQFFYKTWWKKKARRLDLHCIVFLPSLVFSATNGASRKPSPEKIVEPPCDSSPQQASSWPRPLRLRFLTLRGWRSVRAMILLR